MPKDCFKPWDKSDKNSAKSVLPIHFFKGHFWLLFWCKLEKTHKDGLITHLFEALLFLLKWTISSPIHNIWVIFLFQWFNFNLIIDNTDIAIISNILSFIPIKNTYLRNWRIMLKDGERIELSTILAPHNIRISWFSPAGDLNGTEIYHCSWLWRLFTIALKMKTYSG